MLIAYNLKNNSDNADNNRLIIIIENKLKRLPK